MLKFVMEFNKIATLLTRIALIKSNWSVKMSKHYKTPHMLHGTIKHAVSLRPKGNAQCNPNSVSSWAQICVFLLIRGPHL